MGNPSPRTRTVASLDALSTTVWAMHVYFPPWRSWAFRMVRSPTVSFCTRGTGSGAGQRKQPWLVHESGDRRRGSESPALLLPQTPCTSLFLSVPWKGSASLYLVSLGIKRHFFFYRRQSVMVQVNDIICAGGQDNKSRGVSLARCLEFQV